MHITQWMIYGATGYTAKLTIDEAVRRGQQPIVAGRNSEAVIAIAKQYGLEYRIFDLLETYALEKNLADIGLVLNCAGPFEITASKLREASIAAGVHYLDITGEMSVLADSLQANEQAKAAGTIVVSGVGFDVVATDLLAAKLKDTLPDANTLELAFAGGSRLENTEQTVGGISPGTAKTMVRMLAEGGKVREKGEIKTIALAAVCKHFDFVDKPRFCMSIPWGDIETAYHSTGIENIAVFTEIEEKQAKWVKRFDRFKACLHWQWLQRFFNKQINKYIPGPSVSERENACMQLVGKASNHEQSVTIGLTVNEGYDFTVQSSLLLIEALLAHKIMPGAYTPSQIIDFDVFEELDGVSFTALA